MNDGSAQEMEAYDAELQRVCPELVEGLAVNGDKLATVLSHAELTAILRKLPDNAGAAAFIAACVEAGPPVTLRSRWISTLATSGLFAFLTALGILGTSELRHFAWWPLALPLFIPAVVLGKSAAARVSQQERFLRRVDANALFSLPSFLLMGLLVVAPDRGLRITFIAGFSVAAFYGLFVSAWDAVMRLIVGRRPPLA